MKKRKYIITFKRFSIINMKFNDEKYSIITNNIDDVYKTMGKIIARSLEEIRNMRYYSVEI